MNFDTSQLKGDTDEPSYMSDSISISDCVAAISAHAIFSD